MTKNSQTPTGKKSEAEEPKDLKTFFETVPPGRAVFVITTGSYADAGVYDAKPPQLQLYCSTPNTCDGIRGFQSANDIRFVTGRWKTTFVEYTCRNCGRFTKTYALLAHLSGTDPRLFKFGEHPDFGPPTPARLISLLGPEKDYYLKGRAAENQGLGIAAFAYYRRVVVNQKNRILDEIIRVSEKIGASSDILKDLATAKKESRFTVAIEKMKHGIPDALKINGHNPLTLLHTALSDGLHDQTDNDCLELATSIRIVLTELVDRFASALREETEIIAAVNQLAKIKAKEPFQAKVPNPEGSTSHN